MCYNNKSEAKASSSKTMTTANTIAAEPKNPRLLRSSKKSFLGCTLLQSSIIIILCIIPIGESALVLSNDAIQAQQLQQQQQQRLQQYYTGANRAQPVIANDLVELDSNSTSGYYQPQQQQQQQPRYNSAPLYQSIYQQPAQYQKQQQSVLQRQTSDTNVAVGNEPSSSGNAKMPIINGNRATYVEPPADFKPIIYESAGPASNGDPYLMIASSASQSTSVTGNDVETFGAEVSGNHLQQHPSISSSPASSGTQQQNNNNFSKRQTSGNDVDKSPDGFGNNNNNQRNRQHQEDSMNSGDTNDDVMEQPALKPSIGRWSDWHDMSIEPDLASSDSLMTHMYAQKAPVPQQAQGDSNSMAVPASSPHRTRYGSPAAAQTSNDGVQSQLPNRSQVMPSPAVIPVDSNSDGQVTSAGSITSDQQQQRQSQITTSTLSAPMVVPLWSIMQPSQRAWSNQQASPNLMDSQYNENIYHQTRQMPLVPVQSWKLLHHQPARDHQPLIPDGSKFIKLHLIQDGGVDDGNNRYQSRRLQPLQAADNNVAEQPQYYHYYLEQSHNGNQSTAIQGGNIGSGAISSYQAPAKSQAWTPSAAAGAPVHPSDMWTAAASMQLHNQHHLQQQQQLPSRSQASYHHPHGHVYHPHPQQLDQQQVSTAAAASKALAQSQSSSSLSMPMSAPTHLQRTGIMQQQQQLNSATLRHTDQLDRQSSTGQQQVMRSSAPKRRRKSKTNAEVRIQQLVASDTATQSSHPSLPLMASSKVAKQVNGSNMLQKPHNNRIQHQTTSSHHHHQLNDNNHQNLHQSNGMNVDTSSVGINSNQIAENQQVSQAAVANSGTTLTSRHKPAVLVRRFGAPMAQLAASTYANNNHNNIIDNHASGNNANLRSNSGQTPPKRVLKRRRIKTVLPVGLSSWILGGIRDLDGRHWHLPADVINRLVVNDVDLHHETPLSSIQPPGAGNVELVNGREGQSSTTATPPLSSSTLTPQGSLLEVQSSSSTNRPLRPSQMVPR